MSTEGKATEAVEDPGLEMGGGEKIAVLSKQVCLNKRGREHTERRTKQSFQNPRNIAVEQARTREVRKAQAQNK